MSGKQRGGLIIIILLLLAAILGIAGLVVLRQSEGEAEVEMAVSQLTPTATTQLTAIPSPSNTPLAIAQPELATPIPTAVATETPIPTNTPTPTETAVPTETPTVTETAVPITIAPTIPPTSTAPSICYLNEQNGLLIIDVESAPAVGGWTFESGASGYIGSGYYTWRGENHHANPGNGLLSYNININSPGTYLVRLHNFHDNPDSSEGNDAWLRIPGVQGWIKTWSSDVNLWNWGNNFEISANNHREPTVDFSAAGQYMLQLSGRSAGFSIDRIIIVTPNQFVPATNQSWPQSPCL